MGHARNGPMAVARTEISKILHGGATIASDRHGGGGGGAMEKNNNN